MKTYSTAARKFYDSAVWKKCRASYIASVFGLCERCRRPGTILHHKVEINDDNINDPEVTLNHANLAFFCIECHNSIHQKYGVTREDVRFDERGQLVEA